VTAGLVDRRIGLLFAAFLTLLAFAGLRSVQIGVLKGGKLSSAAATQQIRTATVPARRGSITDRNGVALAVSEPADDISATPYLIKDPVSAAAKIAPILGVPEDELLKKLARRDTGFVYLARQVPAAKSDKLQALALPGLQFDPGNHRVYPHGWLAAQVLGSVGTDGNGLFGLEYGFNARLHGHDGVRRTVNDALGKPVAVTDPRPAVAGQGLQLTLDAKIQDKVEQVLQGVGETYRPKGATAIVMDPNDGELLAVANWPRINANDPAGAPGYANEDRAVGFTYEPGSTFKAFTVAGALQDGIVTPATSFDLAPQIQVADRVIGEAETRGPVTLTTAGILAQSSNVGAITIGLREGANRFDKWIHRFGFGKPTGVDLPGEERGLVLPRAKYSGSTMGNLPIGQGISVTPMQMATAYAAIANGGILRSPRIVREVDGRPAATPVGHRVISPAVATQLRTMLEGVFAPGGTASEVSIPGYQLAGKTGTANKIDPTTGEYSKSRYVASFMGFAPAANPKLLVAVMVDEPQGAIYGGTVAAPAFGKIMSFALQYLRIPPTG
jgi:cell division protein FtsI (penicillin-binding protein 3)